PEDVLVLNNTRVFPARLMGERMPTGGSVELLLLREIEPNVWEALARPARRLKPGAKISLGPRLLAEVIDEADHGRRVVRFETDDPLDEVINEIGQTPLPPYIKRDSGEFREDRERYQTVYASSRGAIAAPTAGLHFTPRILEQLKALGIQIAEITLHVG